MKMCKLCGKEFPNRIIYNGKELFLNKRSYCIECSPPGTRGSQRKWTVNRDARVDRICKSCGKEFSHKTRNLECTTCRSKKIRNDKKDMAVEKLGGCCAVCGYNTTIYALEFHHFNPREKDFNLSSNWNKCWEEIEREISKCILLCTRCHVEYHAGMFCFLSDEGIDTDLIMKYSDGKR